MKNIFLFFKEGFFELKEKTVWPSKDEALNASIVVCVSVILISIFLFAVDVIFSGSFRALVIENMTNLKKFVNPFSFFAAIIGLTAFVIFFIYVKGKFRR